MSVKPIQRINSLKFSRILKRNKTISQINVTPMVDVMLVLLVIFMITAPLLTVGVPINLPKTKAKALPEDQTPLSITINKEEKIFVQDTEISLDKLIPKLVSISKNRNDRNFIRFNTWVKEFFTREYIRDTYDIRTYVPSVPAMREEVKYWNPNRSKHAEVYWLENFVFGRKDLSLRNQILNAMAVKFVGMPTLTLVASNSYDYHDVIDFDRYEVDKNYFRSFRGH